MFTCNRCYETHAEMGEPCPPLTAVETVGHYRLWPFSEGKPEYHLKITPAWEAPMNLQPGKRYLLKKKFHIPESHLLEIKIYERAADAIKYSSAPGGFETWALMKYFEDNYTLYAELPVNEKREYGFDVFEEQD